jgi:hypothetical protein
MQKQMSNQREQYRNTVHLFIGTGRSPCKITLIPITFKNNSIVILRGLIWLFIFKSVPLFRRYAEAFLRDRLILRRDRLSSQSSFVFNRAFVYPQSNLEGTCLHISLGKHCQIMFLRTFGSRRPPTTTMLTLLSKVVLLCLGYNFDVVT